MVLVEIIKNLAVRLDQKVSVKDLLSGRAVCWLLIEKTGMAQSVRDAWNDQEADLERSLRKRSIIGLLTCGMTTTWAYDVASPAFLFCPLVMVASV